MLIENLQLAGAVYEFDQTELTGTFRAGEGQGSVRVVLNFDDILAPEVLVQLEGQNLTLVNVPDLSVKATPDLRLTWRGNTLDVAGRDCVVFVDADVDAAELTVQRVDAGPTGRKTMTHHGDPATLLSLVPTVGAPPQRAYVVSIPATNLEMGLELTAASQAAAASHSASVGRRLPAQVA